MPVNNFSLINHLLKFENPGDCYYLEILRRKKDGNIHCTGNNGDRIVRDYLVSYDGFLAEHESEIKWICENLNARAYIRLNRRNYKQISFQFVNDFLAKVSKNDEISSLKIQSQKTISKTLIISTIILIGVFFLLIKQRIAKNKAYNLLKIEKEKALESDQLKSAFLANMSHEIRTPMNAIMGFSEFLKNPSLPIEKRIKFVDIINKSGVRLMTIINDIIDISKIESNQLKLEIREINIIQILKDIVEIQKNTNPQFLAKNIELKYNNLNEYDVLLLKTDENRFVQIVNNLINNAIKFTDNGFVEVGFIKKIHLDKNYIEFYVKDTGCGVSADKFELIFDRFSQAGEHDFKIGNGLGLSICKGILKLLRGEIWLESKVNVGTTFYFTLPY